jgi:hypothetical protein
VYHGIQSFDQRRVMIDRIALYFFEESAHSSAWDEINSSLMAAAPNRNKVAHYCVEYEMTSFGKTLAETAFGAPHLIPSRYNVVDFLKGRTPDKKGHKLSTTELSSYIREFDGIRAKINKLIDAVSLPPPQQGLGLLQAASRGTGMLGGGLLGTTPATDPPRAK